ncbi:hypothetical protein SAMN05216359_102471 [Roseateles sp. YR242]|uniref:hypothetical protein n=1 Tax=Roseateles sp. YR242 TaxID=1855305 RepID=UPI0008B00FAC|nr:hypothetical protein [Roseateles sp. YR242]SEK63148.1 hypothetical protein SAMN05216359_102471 [Roseateles sp. YR242]
MNRSVNYQGGRHWISAALAVSALLSACGGGGNPASGGPESASAGTLPTAPAPVAQAPRPAASDPVSPTLQDASPSAAAPAASSGAQQQTSDALILPIEVLGPGLPDAPTIASRALTLDATGAANTTELWFQCHRCGFFGAPEFEATRQTPPRVKASVRVLGGAADSGAVPWVDITDANVRLADAERLQGGLNRGGLYTARMSLALDTATRARLIAGSNTIQFRFNGSDGETSGLRIVALQLRDVQGRSLATNPVQNADIGAEKAAGQAMTPDVSAGEVLWNAQNRLLKSVLTGSPIQASCASCHAEGGRDLQYFNYSNNSIVQRARFHGLSEREGQQISAYIRNAMQAVAHVPKAAPWNPPYQPGPGLDSRPIAEWAAGAGLEAVVESPADAMKALFGKPMDGKALAITQADVDKVMDATGTLNNRETAVPIQYPDWNAYLPAIHPMDIWPKGADPSGDFESGATFVNGRLNPLATAQRIKAWFVSHRNANGVHGDWSHLTPVDSNQIQSMIRPYGFEVYSWIGGQRGNHIATGGLYGSQVGGANLQRRASSASMAREPEAFTSNAFIERAVGSLLQWNVVQQWSWAQTFGLEGDQRWFIGDYDATSRTWKGRGEIRGWPFNTVSAFYLAPHMVYQADHDASGRVTREWVQAWEAGNRVGAYYRTSAWYQAQASINAGAQSDWANYPMDWPYMSSSTDVLANTIGESTPAHVTQGQLSRIRRLHTHIKIAQYANSDIPMYVPTDTRSLLLNRGRFGRAAVMRGMIPTSIMDIKTQQADTPSPYKRLEQLQPGVLLMIVNGGFRQFNQLYAGTDPAAWRRCAADNMDLGEPEPYAGFAFCLDVGREPLVQATTGGMAMRSIAGRRFQTAEQQLQYALWKGAQLGADPARMAVTQAWTDRVWP